MAPGPTPHSHPQSHTAVPEEGTTAWEPPEAHILRDRELKDKKGRPVMGYRGLPRWTGLVKSLPLQRPPSFLHSCPRPLGQQGSCCQAWGGVEMCWGRFQALVSHPVGVC